MAGDWIKVEKLTPDKPELLAVAHDCHCSAADAFTAWFRLWAYFDSATEDGVVRFMSASDADRIGQMSGVGAALERTGWLRFDDTGCVIAKWTRHNGKSAKRRALDSERKAELRSALSRQNVRMKSGQNADQSESESENDTDTPNPPQGDVAAPDMTGWEGLVSPANIVRYVRNLTTADPSATMLACWKAAMTELATRNADPEAVGLALDAFAKADPKFRGTLPDARRLKADWFLGLVTKYGGAK